MTHRIRCIGGRYVCQAEGCEFDTLNRWVAESHIVEENDLDPEEVETDAPTEILQ